MPIHDGRLQQTWRHSKFGARVGRRSRHVRPPEGGTFSYRARNKSTYGEFRLRSRIFGPAGICCHRPHRGRQLRRSGTERGDRPLPALSVRGAPVTTLKRARIRPKTAGQQSTSPTRTPPRKVLPRRNPRTPKTTRMSANSTAMPARTTTRRRPMTRPAPMLTTRSPARMTAIPAAPTAARAEAPAPTAVRAEANSARQSAPSPYGKGPIAVRSASVRLSGRSATSVRRTRPVPRRCTPTARPWSRARRSRRPPRRAGRTPGSSRAAPAP